MAKWKRCRHQVHGDSLGESWGLVRCDLAENHDHKHAADISEKVYVQWPDVFTTSMAVD